MLPKLWWMSANVTVELVKLELQKWKQLYQKRQDKVDFLSMEYSKNPRAFNYNDDHLLEPIVLSQEAGARVVLLEQWLKAYKHETY